MVPFKPVCRFARDGAADGAQRLARAIQRRGAAAVGEDAEVADAVHPLRQDVEQEASDELVGRDGHGAVAGLLLPRLGRLAVAEGDVLAVEGDDAPVRDGDPVGVAGEVPEHLLRPPEGALGVDHPISAAGGGEGAVELAGIGEMGDGAVELQLAAAMGARKVFEEAAAGARYLSFFVKRFDGDDDGRGASEYSSVSSHHP